MQNQIEYLREKAEKIEPLITQDMLSIIASVSAKSAGLEYRLKSLDSLQRKVKTEILAGMTEQQALKTIKDVIRYTTIFNEDTFVEQYELMQEKLQEKGYQTMIVKNSWQHNSAYKGINTFITTLVEKDNIVFEMQYHTQQSFELKNGQLHQLYEQFRDSNIPQSEKHQILLEMQNLSAKLKTPKDIHLIKGKK